MDFKRLAAGLVCMLLIVGFLSGCILPDGGVFTPTPIPTPENPEMTSSSADTTFTPGLQYTPPVSDDPPTAEITQSGTDTHIPPTTDTPPVPTIEPDLSIHVSNYQALSDLISSNSLKTGDVIRFTEGFIIEREVRIPEAVSLVFEGRVDCRCPIYIESSAKAELFVTVGEQASDDLLDLRYDAPQCSLTVNGGSIYSDEATAAHLTNLKSYNGTDLTEKYGIGGQGTKKIASFIIKKSDNPKLDSDIIATVDTNICYLTYDFSTNLNALKNAIVQLTMTDGSSATEELDLTVDKQIYNTVDCLGGKRGYAVISSIIEHNLPVVYIQIENNQEVSSKEDYLNATISISTENAYGDFPELTVRSVLIRGRGHFTWNFDKKPYKLRFESKTSVLGLAKSKNWVLLANYVDRSLIQNYVAMEMGKIMTNIPYHSNQFPVDVFVNGTYRGVYTLGEQLEGKEERIGLEENYEDVDTDYLLEIGGSDPDDVLGRDYFHAGTLNFLAIKHPDSSELKDEQLKYLIDYVKKADRAVQNLSGYEEYIDVDSLIDWVIIHELTYNLDCCFRRSCYLIKEKGGKLKMGPIWDFDLAFGSYYRYTRDNFATVGSDGGYVGITWMNYLMKDKSFMERLTARWNEIKAPLLKTAVDSVDYMSGLVAPSAEYNFQVWDILGKSLTSQPSSHKKYDTYEKMVERLKSFINNRYNWLDEQLN